MGQILEGNINPPNPTMPHAKYLGQGSRVAHTAGLNSAANNSLAASTTGIGKVFGKALTHLGQENISRTEAVGNNIVISKSTIGKRKLMPGGNVANKMSNKTYQHSKTSSMHTYLAHHKNRQGQQPPRKSDLPYSNNQSQTGLTKQQLSFANDPHVSNTMDKTLAANKAKQLDVFAYNNLQSADLLEANRGQNRVPVNQNGRIVHGPSLSSKSGQGVVKGQMQLKTAQGARITGKISAHNKPQNSNFGPARTQVNATKATSPANISKMGSQKTAIIANE
jgi:hypothetical protein